MWYVCLHSGLAKILLICSTVKLRECSLSALLMSDRKTRSVGTLMANWNVDNKADWWRVTLDSAPELRFPPNYYLELHHGQGEAGLLLVKGLVRRAYKHRQPAQIFLDMLILYGTLLQIFLTLNSWAKKPIIHEQRSKLIWCLFNHPTFSFISIFKCLPNLLDLLSVCSKVGAVKSKHCKCLHK